MPYYDILHKWHDEHNVGYGIPYWAVTCHFEVTCTSSRSDGSRDTL